LGRVMHINELRRKAKAQEKAQAAVAAEEAAEMAEIYGAGA